MSELSPKEKRPSEESSADQIEAALPDQADQLARERRIIRHVDWTLLPFLGLLYAIALIDRTNLAVARVSGMEKDLKLYIGDRYSITSCLFFVPYILLQLPSNLILRHANPVVLLSSYVVAWGAVQLGMGFVKSWGYLVLCRCLLGALEAGFFPGMVYIITTWYKRHEVQKRLALFYLISVVIGGFSAILAYAFQLLRGRGGLNGWQWIFIIEGILTIVLGVVAWFFIPSFPDQNKFLTKEETAIVLDRVEKDRGDSVPDEITKEKVLHHLSDWTTWVYSLMFFCSTVPAYAISYFITIILATMGYTTKESLLLTAPPYVVAATSCLIFAVISDRTRRRALIIAIQVLITITGLFITTYSKRNKVRYFGLFLINAGASGCVPGVMAYNANNIVSQSKRAVSTALIVSWGGIGGIFATTVFRQKDFPRYFNGLWAAIGCQFLLLILLGVLTITYSRRNRLVKEGKLVAEGQPGFYYTL